MANLNFDTTVTDWTTNSGSATAVPNSIPKTQFESMLTGLVPQNDFFDRSIVVNASDNYDFRVGSSGNELLHVDNSLSAVGIGGSPVVGYELTVSGNTKIQTDSEDSSTELWVNDPNSDGIIYVSGSNQAQLIAQGGTGGELQIRDTGITNETFQIINADGTTDFNVKNGSTDIATAMQVDMTTGNVGIGGAAATSTYELMVTGNTLITSANAGTELTVSDTGGGMAYIYVEGASAGMSLNTTSGDSSLYWRNTSSTTDNAFVLDNVDSTKKTRFRTYDWDASTGSATNFITAIEIDNATGNVGVGGAASTSTYELKVYGNMQIAGDDVGSTTELVVVDTANIARILVDGEQGSDVHIRSDAGDAEIFLTTLTDTSTTNNQFNIRNNGTETQFLVYDYTQTTTPNSTNGDLVIDIDNATASVGIGGNADTSYQLKVVGDTWAYGKLYVGTSSTDNPYLTSYQSSGSQAATDIISATNLGGSLSTTEAGLLLSGDPAGHIVAAIRANDSNDSFTIAVPDNVDDNTELNPDCDKSVFRATYNSVTINPSSRAVDFRVESDGNANMLHVDGANSQVGIGCDPAATASTYALVVEGSQYIKSSGGVGGTELLIQDTTSPSKLVLYGVGNTNIVMQDATTSTNQLQSFRISCSEGSMRFDQTDNTQSTVEASFGRWHRPRDGANAVDATYFASSTFSDVANNSTTQRVGSQLVVGGTHADNVTYQQHGSAPATLIVTNNDSHNASSNLTSGHGVGVLVENTKAWDATTSPKDNANIVIKGNGTAVQQFYDTSRGGTSAEDAVNVHVAGGKFGIGAPAVGGATQTAGIHNDIIQIDIDTGHIQLRCRDVAPADSLLTHNHINFYLDGSTLKAKVKNASGTVSTHTLS